MKKLIIYDLDGTLVDTQEDIAAAVNFMLARMNKPPLPVAEIAGYVGHGLYHLIKDCLKTENEAEIKKGSEIYRRYYGEHMLDHSRLFPGAVEFLRHFRGRKQAVITNKPNPFSERLLAALGVAEFFFLIVPGNSEYPQKPDPTSVKGILLKDEIQPEETLLVGDSPIDVQFARNAGIEIACLSHGFSNEDEIKYAQPDYIASDFKKLLEVAREMKW